MSVAKVFGFVAAVAVVSGACYGIAFSAYPSLSGTLLNLVPLFLYVRDEFTPPYHEPMTVKGILLGVFVIGLLLFGTVSGFFHWSNEAFAYSSDRQWVALGLWVLYVSVLYVAIFRRRTALLQRTPNYSLKRTAANRTGVG